ncbi:ABC transporter substrate-binding protein, partial [bacterium]|nr:ABC transporter substrate-binding protein [bacterium]
MRKYHIITLLLFSAALLLNSGCQKKQSPVEDVTLRFGVLPVMQALPLFIAEERGYFAEANVKVELIPFNTAADKDIAMVSGSIDGQFADLFTPIVLEGNGVNISIVATNYDTQD